MARPSIYEMAGGEPALLRLAAAHHERCLADPVLNHPFSHGVHAEHVARLARYWGEVFGGPTAFSHDCGGQTPMLAMHAGTGAEDDLGARFVDCFVAAADDAMLPADPALRQALRDYMKWAVDQVMFYAPRGSVVPSDLPMPKWGWDGLVSA